MLQELKRLADGFKCTEDNVRGIVEVFVSCLERIAITLLPVDQIALRDDQFSHLWMTSSGATPAVNSNCQCGAYSYEERMSFSMLKDNNKSIINTPYLLGHENQCDLNLKLLDSAYSTLGAITSGASLVGMIITINKYIQNVN